MHKRSMRALEGMRSLDGIAEKIGTAASKALRPAAVKDLLSGTWLGHPVHPMLTDVPIGAWTSAFFLDLFGGERSRRAADGLIGLGVVGAVPTAITGLSDFTDIEGKPRRVGLVHAAGNTGAVLLYGLSFLARRAGRRRAGLALSWAGAGVASASAYLGGHLSYARGIGVNQTAFESFPGKWADVMAADALPEGKPVQATLGTTEILLFRANGSLYALADRCTHRGGPLHKGDVSDGCVTCPWHGSTFRLDDGEISSGPATVPQPTLEARQREGRIEVRSAD